MGVSRHDLTVIASSFAVGQKTCACLVLSFKVGRVILKSHSLFTYQVTVIYIRQSRALKRAALTLRGATAVSLPLWRMTSQIKGAHFVLRGIGNKSLIRTWLVFAGRAPCRCPCSSARSRCSAGVRGRCSRARGAARWMDG